MSKTHRAIQVLSKIGFVITKIVFICCIIGAAGCLIGGVVMGTLGESRVFLETKNWLAINAGIYDLTLSNIYSAVAVGFICCAGECVLAKFANIYFANELKAQTPFTTEGANELLRLGIMTCAISLVTTIVCAISVEVISHVMRVEPSIDIDFGGQIGIGLAIIVISLLCRYGAECVRKNAESNIETEEIK